MFALDAQKPGRLRCIVRADDRQTAFMELRAMTQKADKQTIANEDEESSI